MRSLSKHLFCKTAVASTRHPGSLPSARRAAREVTRPTRAAEGGAGRLSGPSPSRQRRQALLRAPSVHQAHTSKSRAAHHARRLRRFPRTKCPSPQSRRGPQSRAANFAPKLLAYLQRELLVPRQCWPTLSPPLLLCPSPCAPSGQRTPRAATKSVQIRSTRAARGRW